MIHMKDTKVAAFTNIYYNVISKSACRLQIILNSLSRKIMPKIIAHISNHYTSIVPIFSTFSFLSISNASSTFKFEPTQKCIVL